MPKRNRGPHLYWRKDRREWVIRWFEGGRSRKKSTGFGHGQESDAAEALATFILEREDISEAEPKNRNLGDVMDSYLKERAPHVADPARLGYAVQALLPYWGEKNVSDVTETTCREYAVFRPVKPGTVRRELTALRASMSHDVRHNRLTKAPYVWMPKRPESKDRWLTRSEAARLLRAAKTPHIKLFIRMALYTGARKEALLSLRWSQVDLDSGIINFNVPGRERTKKVRPIIPIPDRLMPVLRRAKKYGSPTGYVIQWNGKPVGNVKHAITRCCERAGLEGVTPHVFRHTTISWLAQKGVPFTEISRYVGHEDSGTTERIYAHHAPDFLNRIKSAFG